MRLAKPSTRSLAAPIGLAAPVARGSRTCRQPPAASAVIEPLEPRRLCSSTAHATSPPATLGPSAVEGTYRGNIENKVFGLTNASPVTLRITATSAILTMDTFNYSMAFTRNSFVRLRRGKLDFYSNEGQFSIHMLCTLSNHGKSMAGTLQVRGAIDSKSDMSLQK